MTQPSREQQQWAVGRGAHLVTVRWRDSLAEAPMRSFARRAATSLEEMSLLEYDLIFSISARCANPISKALRPWQPHHL